MIKSIHYVSKCDVMPVRSVLFSMFVVMAAAASARTILVPAQPVSEFADTEVSTNIVLHASRTDTREFGIHIQLAGTPTNALEVAFGRDANTNGVLEVDEVETAYGWRAGRYFVENVRAWERIEAEAAANALWNPPVAEGDQVGRMSEANEPRSGRKSPGVVDIQLRNDAQTVPRRFTATCGISPERSEPRQRSLEGCVAAFPELATMPPPAWLFREEWDMVRVTRRGAGVPSEWVRCDIEYASFAIRLR